MKISVGLILFAFLGATTAVTSQSPDQIATTLYEYAQTKISSVIRQPSVGRSGGGMACYEKYIPLINAATTNSKSDTESCNSLAATRRQDELNKVKEQRVTIDNQLATVQTTLSDCVKKTDALEYLTCLKDSSILLQSNIEQVTKTSTALADGLSGAYVNIDNSENVCIQRVIDKVKSETDTLTSALQSCLLNGFDEPSTESSSTSTTTETPSTFSTTSTPVEDSSSTTTPSESSSESSSSAALFEVTPNANQLPEEQL